MQIKNKPRLGTSSRSRDGKRRDVLKKLARRLLAQSRMGEGIPTVKLSYSDLISLLSERSRGYRPTSILSGSASASVSQDSIILSISCTRVDVSGDLERKYCSSWSEVLPLSSLSEL